MCRHEKFIVCLCVLQINSKYLFYHFLYGRIPVLLKRHFPDLPVFPDIVTGKAAVNLYMPILHELAHFPYSLHGQVILILRYPIFINNGTGHKSPVIVIIFTDDLFVPVHGNRNRISILTEFHLCILFPLHIGNHCKWGIHKRYPFGPLDIQIGKYRCLCLPYLADRIKTGPVWGTVHSLPVQEMTEIW